MALIRAHVHQVLALRLGGAVGQLGPALVHQPVRLLLIRRGDEVLVK